MVVAMARKLVTFHDDAAHQLRMALGDPAKHEESGLDPCVAEHVEHPAGIELDPRLGTVPCGPEYRSLERRDLKILLDVDGQCIADHGRHRARSPTHQPS